MRKSRKDSWSNPTCEILRHRKIGSVEFMIYYCADSYVLQRQEPHKGEFIFATPHLRNLLPVYEDEINLEKEK